MEKKGDPDPNCLHSKVDLIGGSADDMHTWDTFKCQECGWTFDLEHLEPQG